MKFFIVKNNLLVIPFHNKIQDIYILALKVYYQESYCQIKYSKNFHHSVFPMNFNLSNHEPILSFNRHKSRFYSREFLLPLDLKMVQRIAKETQQFNELAKLYGTHKQKIQSKNAKHSKEKQYSSQNGFMQDEI